MRKKLTQAAAAAALGVVTFGATDATADTTRWKLHSAFTKSTPILGLPPFVMAEDIEQMSGGDFKIKVFEPGAIVSGTAYYDAVANGSIDAGFGTPAFHVGKNSAFAFFSSIPFGPGTGEYLAWMMYGGGTELLREIYARDNIHYELCGILPPETSGWFREEINTSEDLKGLKMRFFGLGAKVMETLGVSTQLLAGGDIYPALELGAIDAAEFSMPAIDRSKGFYQIAKYNYFPGWHQQSTTEELIVNMDSWNALSNAERTMITTSCRAATLLQIAEGEYLQFAAMQANVEDGAIVKKWSQEMLDVFQSGWKQVVADEISNNPDSAAAWASLSEFRANYEIWKDHGYLN